MHISTEERTSAEPGAEDQSVDELRELIESKFGLFLTRKRVKEVLPDISDRHLDDLIENELEAYQRRPGKSGSRVWVSARSLAEFLHRSRR